MEKSVEFEIADYIKEVLEMKEVEPEGYSPSDWGKQTASAFRGKPHRWLGDPERQPHPDQTEAV